MSFRALLLAAVSSLILVQPVHAVTRSWTGANSASWSDAGNWSPAAVPAPEDTLVFPAGVTRTTMTNDLPAGTSFGAMHFAIGYTVDGNAMTLTGDLTFDQSTYPHFVMNAPLTIGADVRLGAAITSEYHGAIDVNGHTLAITSYNTRLIGAVNGTGTIDVAFPGVSIENGGTFTGTIKGIVDVRGSLPNAAVIGAATGHGTIAALTATQPVYLGTKVPAYTDDPHAIGTLHTQSASIASLFFVDLVPGGVSDQLDVTGTVTLADAWLNLSVPTGAVSAGQNFTIIANDGTDAVSGTFSGLPEGGQRAVSGGTVAISYHGGDGNDVVLTVVDAKKTWTGAVSANWSDPNNWSPAAIPIAGESLVFPAGVARTSMVNDLTGASAGAMDFRNDYTLSGNTLTLTGNVSFGPSVFSFLCHAPLVIGGDLLLGSALINEYTGAIDVNGHTLTISSYNTTVHTLLGTGTINVTGSGMRVAAAGTFDGTINGGVDVVGLPNADIAGGSVSGSGTIGTLSRSEYSLRLYLGAKNPAHTDDPHTIGTLRTQSVAMSSALFFVDLVPSAASDQLIVTGSVTLSDAWLNLSVPSGSISDGQSFVIIDNDGTDPVSGTFTGLPEGATRSVGGATLTISYAGGDGNDVVLSAGNATKSWTGAQSALWSNPANWSPAAIPASGEALRFPAGAAHRTMTNDLNLAAGALDFRDSYILDGNALTLTGNVTFDAQSFVSNAPLVLGADVQVGNALTNDYHGAIDVNGHTLTIDSYNTSFAGPLNGTGAVVIRGSGMTFSGGGTFGGTINGIAEVLGAMPHAVIHGGLVGNGSVDAATIDSRLAPGAWTPAHSSDPHAIGTLETQSISVDGLMMVDVVAGAASDQLKVHGAVTLGNVTLGVSVPTGSPAAGETFTIIDNDGTDAIDGTFANRAEGSLFTSGPWMFRITYAGGDGNDVVLTAVEPTEVQTGQSAATTQFGQTATFTAQVGARVGTPNGSVTFTDNGAALDTVPLVNGTATLQTELEPGTHTVAAVYEGTTLFGPSQGAMSHVVLRGNTTSELNISPTNVVYGVPIDVSVAVHPVAPASGTPTGNVIIATSTAALTNGNATASLVLDAGEHSIIAGYAGDARFDGSKSNASNVTVLQAPTKTAAALNDNMLTITVTAPHRPSLGVSGHVIVTENGATLAQQSIANGSAVLDLGPLSTGDHALLVSFASPKNFESSSTSVAFTAGPPQVSVRAVSVFEGNGEKDVAVLVELSAATAETVSVSYATEDATAIAGSDYRAASGTLTFAPGETTKTISITIAGDTRVEDDESLLIRLSAPVNAILGNAAASVKLVNDDLSYRARYGLVYAAPMTLDLYTPSEGTGPFPLIVFVPGTNAYDAQDAAPAALRETSRGYAVAVVRYRTPNAARFPAQLDDLRAAVRWLRTSASSLNIDTTRIAAWGHGAGAHLASLLGTANDAGTGGSVSGNVQSVIAWGGATDLMQLQSDSAAQGCGANFDDRNSAQSQLLGCALPSCTQSAIAASPLSHVTSGDAPFLLLHTRNDCNVPLAQSTRLRDALRAAGVRATLSVVDDAAHAFTDIDAFLDAQRTSRRRAASP